MSYRIYYSDEARKYLKRIPNAKGKAVVKKIANISINPYSQHMNVVVLQGIKAHYRIRIGDLRIIYRLDDKVKCLYVLKIAPRGSIYSA